MKGDPLERALRKLLAAARAYHKANGQCGTGCYADTGCRCGRLRFAAAIEDAARALDLRRSQGDLLAGVE